MQVLSQGISPSFMNLLNSCVQQVSIQISLILWFFSNMFMTTCIVALEQTKNHLIVKPIKTKSRTKPQAPVLLCFLFTFPTDIDFISWNALKSNGNVIFYSHNICANIIPVYLADRSLL